VIYFLLPAYNEETAIPLVLDAISKLIFPGEDRHVVVVDDGSSDHTPFILTEWSGKIPMTIITHSENEGLGRAMHTGLMYLGDVVSDTDAVVALDSDNTHDPSLAIRMRRKAADNSLDIVIASRYHTEDSQSGEEIGLSLQRKIMSRGASLLLNLAFHVKGASDYTCGFRLYSGPILKRAISVYGTNLVEEKNFVCMAEILVKMARIGARVGEVPMTLRYDLKGGASKLRVTRTIARYFSLIWRYKVLGELNKYKVDRTGK
jgi:dolichol-phosphate mannosyltransferase